MDKKLFLQAIAKFAAGLALTGLVLFLPAGTFAYPQAWLLTAVLFVPMFAAGLVMLKKSPELLKKRLDAKEKQGDQKLVVALSGCMFLSSFVLAGLSFRFSWLMLPLWASFAAAALFLAAYALYARVLKENEWLSRTIEMQEGQKVVDTGLYGVVRHPMYMATLLLFLSMPLVLGSALSFIVMLAYVPIVVKRIRGEERVLEEGLPGYREYEKRVRCRLVPRVW